MREAFLIFALWALHTAPQVLAASPGGCDAFKWPVAKDIALITGENRLTAETGAAFKEPAEAAIDVTLKPQSEVAFTVKPEGQPKLEPAKAHGAILSFEGVTAPGVYQVTLSKRAWIDVVQNGAALKSLAHTGKSDCASARKSVRFDIGSGPFRVQLSDVAETAITIVVRPKSD